MSERTYGNARNGSEGSVTGTLVINLKGEHTIHVWESATKRREGGNVSLQHTNNRRGKYWKEAE